MTSKFFTLQHNDQQIHYNIQYTKRKTIGIEVCANSEVIVKAPFTTSINLIEQIVKKKSNWITKKIAYFQEIKPNFTPLKYINNAQHLYLGKEYPLKIFIENYSKVNLINGYLQITSRQLQPEKLKELLQKWYIQQANNIFIDLFSECWDVFSTKITDTIPKPLVKIKTMKSRWGSCSIKHKITLNSELIKTDVSCIKYVIMHELCHLIHFNHSKLFYILLYKLMPDWKKHDSLLKRFCVL